MATYVSHRHIVKRLCIGSKAQVGNHLVEAIAAKAPSRPAISAPKRQLRNSNAGKLQRQKHGWHGIGKNQHTVLRYLGISDALHATQHGVNEDTMAIPIYKPVSISTSRKAGKHNTNTAHLTSNVGERNKYQANRLQPSRAVLE